MGNSLLLGFLLVCEITKPHSEHNSVVQDETEIHINVKIQNFRLQS